MPNHRAFSIDVLFSYLKLKKIKKHKKTKKTNNIKNERPLETGQPQERTQEGGRCGG
jgi:hypothetical protein